MKTAIRMTGGTAPETNQERRPFVRLEAHSIPELPPSALSGLTELERFLGDDVPLLVQVLVKFAFGTQLRRDPIARRTAPSVSALNRRRRAATQWIQAILMGQLDPETLHGVGHGLIPQLAGGGPELYQAERLGRECIEFFRGAASARVMAEPAGNLVPHAKALYTLDAILASHLDAYERAVEQSRPTAAAAD